MGLSDEDLKEGHRKRLRERYFNSGLEAFHDHEVLELLLTYAIPRKDVKPLAKQLLLRFGTLRNVMDAETFELLNVPDMGESSAGLFRLIKDVASRYLEEEIRLLDVLDNMDKVSDFLRMKIGGGKKELFVPLYLDSHNHPIALSVMEGTISNNNISLRVIVEQGLECKARKLIIAHNHPSGMLEPSAADILFTRKLKMVLSEIDIELCDHLIIARNMCHSIMPLVELNEKEPEY